MKPTATRRETIGTETEIDRIVAAGGHPVDVARKVEAYLASIARVRRPTQAESDAARAAYAAAAKAASP